MKLLFCEGKEDKAVIELLLKYQSISGVIIEDVRSQSNFGPVIENLPTRPEIVQGKVEAIGFIRDADYEHAGIAAAHAKVQSLQNSLTKAGFASPTAHNSFAGNNPKIGIFITSLPSGNGMIEDLCLECLTDTVQKECMSAFFDCLKSSQQLGPINKSKAKMKIAMALLEHHSTRWIDTLDNPIWDWSHPVFNDLRLFLRSL